MTTSFSVQTIKILGIDPGTRLVGFALLSCQKQAALSFKGYEVIDAGVLRADLRLNALERLGALHASMFGLASSWQPQLCVIESAFTAVNPQSALKLGQARGALTAALSRCGVAIAEIAPTQVKRLITGNGHADKAEVSQCLQRLLGFEKGGLPFDVTDALAIALAYSLHHYRQLPWQAPTEKSSASASKPQLS